MLLLYFETIDNLKLIVGNKAMMYARKGLSATSKY